MDKYTYGMHKDSIEISRKILDSVAFSKGNHSDISGKTA
jgi:hypothetical protein